MQFDFNGKNVLITGGSTGLGFETAKLFVSNGANVIICSRNVKELEAASSKLSEEKINQSQQIRFTKADVGNISEIDSLFAFSGTPDVLITSSVSNMLMPITGLVYIFFILTTSDYSITNVGVTSVGTPVSTNVMLIVPLYVPSIVAI